MGRKAGRTVISFPTHLPEVLKFSLFQTSIRWRTCSAQARTVYSLRKIRARSCTWDVTTKEPSTGEDLWSWGVASLKGTWGILGDNKLDMSQRCVATTTMTYQILGCTHRDFTSRDRDPALPSTCQSTLGILCSVLVPAIPKRTWTDWRGSKRGPWR